MNESKTEWKSLTEEDWKKRLTETQFKVLRKKATQERDKRRPDFAHKFPAGTYHCVACNSALFDGTARFECGCGWPAFESVRSSAVVEAPDADGQRTEVVCATCAGHLGHVFRGEELTKTNTRYCINECCLSFVATAQKS